MLESLRKLYYSNIWKKIYLIKLKLMIDDDIIESWRIQKYEIINNKRNYNKEKIIININEYITNIILLLNSLRYKYIFDKYSINIEIFTLLLNNLCNIYYFYDIKLDELIEYIINIENNINNFCNIDSISNSFVLCL
jgi:hypothetical protein